MPWETSLSVPVSEPQVCWYDRHLSFIYCISTIHTHADFHTNCAFIQAATFYLHAIYNFIKIQHNPQLCFHHSPIFIFPRGFMPIAFSIPIISHCFHSFLMFHCRSFSMIPFFMSYSTNWNSFCSLTQFFAAVCIQKYRCILFRQEWRKKQKYLSFKN